VGVGVRIAYIIPEGQYQFFTELIGALTSRGFEVSINRVGNDCDLILAAILPLTHGFHDAVVRSGLPTILWHWDHYSFVDMAEPRWRQFNRLLVESLDPSRNIEVWSCGYETARLLKEQYGVDSVIMPGWVNVERLLQGGTMRTPPFAFYASSSASFGKRTDWAEHACKMLGIPLVLTKGIKLSPQEYIDHMASCRVYLCTAFEESNATLPATEAAALGKPVVCADLPSAKEVFGPTGAWYFRNDSFSDLLDKLKGAWASPNSKLCYNRVMKCFDLGVVADKIALRMRSFRVEIQRRLG
jgi:glycosyltransferase involved in cell wall biosynthesis